MAPIRKDCRRQRFHPCRMTAPVSVRAFCPATCCGHISALPCLENTGNFFPLVPEQLSSRPQIQPRSLSIGRFLCCLIRHPPMRFPLCSSHLHPRLWLLRATSRHRSQHLCARCHFVADAPPPGGAGTDGCVSSGAGLLSPSGEESSPAPSERNAKHEHNRKPHLNRMPRNRFAASQPSHQTGKIPGSTPGMENRFITGMSHTRHHATL